jgi:hypothetical protein
MDGKLSKGLYQIQFTDNMECASQCTHAATSLSHSVLTQSVLSSDNDFLILQVRS